MRNTACGVSPRCEQTGISRSTRWRMTSSFGPAPSIFTIAAPARRKAVAASSARCGLASPWNGMSATSSA